MSLEGWCTKGSALRCPGLQQRVRMLPTRGKSHLPAPGRCCLRWTDLPRMLQLWQAG